MAADATAMAREKKSSYFQIRCSAAWLERVEKHAEKLDIATALYIRQAVTERMDRESLSEPEKPRPPRRKPPA